MSNEQIANILYHIANAIETGETLTIRQMAEYFYVKAEQDIVNEMKRGVTLQ